MKFNLLADLRAFVLAIYDLNRFFLSKLSVFIFKTKKLNYLLLKEEIQYGSSVRFPR